MTDSLRYVYLSPHYDDASLSCGGAIHKYVQSGQTVLVVTVCAAPPQPGDPLSPFAQELHSFWGSPEDVVATRRTEDQRAMAALKVDNLQLEFSDCIYRGQPNEGVWYYNDDTELFGQIHPADLALADEIAASIIGQVPVDDNTVICAPLTVGNHIDHQLVHAAAWQLQDKIRALVFFEDYPYSDPGFAPHGLQHTPDLAKTLARLKQANLQPQLVSLAEEDVQAKISSIAAYESQIPFLLGGQSEMAEMVRNYAALVGDGSPAERVWLPK